MLFHSALHALSSIVHYSFIISYVQTNEQEFLIILKYIDCAFPTLHQQCSTHITKVKSCELPPFSNSLELDPSDKHQIEGEQF